MDSNTRESGWPVNSPLDSPFTSTSTATPASSHSNDTDSIHNLEKDQGKEPHRRYAIRIRPNKTNPALTAGLVRSIVNKKHTDHLKVANDMAPIFGLGSDFISQQRAQQFFSHPVVASAMGMIELSGLAEYSCNDSAAEWSVVYPIALQHVVDPAWTRRKYAAAERGQWDVAHYYAYFMVRTLHEIRNPRTRSLQMAHWVRDADLVNAMWVLFHMILYLHLERKGENEGSASLKAKIRRTFTR